jgi:SAM-dependent methyltransferase
MPTIPSSSLSSASDRAERAQRTPQPPRAYRELAQSFGGDPERYDRTRPAYPDVLIQRIVDDSPGREVLDVGCGTGIAARQLQAAGCAVLGVEPDTRMAEFARRSGIEVEVTTFEAWDPAGREFDAVTAATVWHWLDPVASAVKAAQVLRPRGLLAVFGHVFALPAEVQDAFSAAYREVAPDSPFASNAGPAREALDAYERLYAAAADAIRQTGEFAEPRRQRFDWERSYSREEWLDQLLTHGTLTRLAPDKLAPVLDAVGAAVDALGGNVSVSYATVAVTAARILTD